MKNFLQNLLIVFALCLCALIAFQWVRETDLRKQLQAQADVIHEKAEAIQSLQVQGKRLEDEVRRLDTLKNDLNATIKTNRLEITKLTRDVTVATAENERNQKQAAAYKDAFERANEGLKAQNESIKKQNEEMAKLAEERNEIVKKFNKIAADYNDLVTKWNKQQEDLAAAAAAATNAPPKK